MAVIMAEPGGEVVMSNQASMISSVAVAAAVRQTQFLAADHGYAGD